MSKWGTQAIGGAVASSAAPPTRGRGTGFDATGLLVRGVVIAVYVSNGDSAFPDNLDPNRNLIYADVLVYSVKASLRGTILRRVSCGVGGVHDGRLWKPRAATRTISGRSIDGATDDPLDLDGDHLLIGFIDGDLSLPTMVRQLEQPRRNAGTPDGLSLGQRDTLVLADGQPDLWKHHGSFFGVDDNGDFVVDTRRAHKGEFADGAAEQPDGGAAHGNVRVITAPDSTVTIVGMTADGSAEAFRFAIDKTGMRLQIDGNDTGVPVARANHLQTLYAALKSALEIHAPHVHPSAMGPTGTPVPPLVLPDWIDAIASDHSFIPDEQPDEQP